MTLLSVVIPALNEAEALPALLGDLTALRAAGGELIVVDGGSRDGTVERSLGLADRVLHSAPGRALQMNVGAAHATGDYLWFLHADSRVSPACLAALRQVLAEKPQWGRFDVRLSGAGPSLWLIGSMINLRSRLTGIASGDQGMFVRRALFESLGGYADIPLMEDLELCRRLRQRGRPYCLRPALSTSSRRWEQHGTWRTVWLMWRLRLAYYRGVSPELLADRYRGGAQR